MHESGILYYQINTLYYIETNLKFVNVWQWLRVIRIWNLAYMQLFKYTNRERALIYHWIVRLLQKYILSKLFGCFVWFVLNTHVLGVCVKYKFA